MKITLVMATTINGFVAGLNDDTNWVKDFDLFYKTVADFGVAVMGKRTYLECIKYDVFPYKGALNIVMTHDKKILAQKQENVIFTDESPKDVVAMVEKKGFTKMLVIGGGHLNGSFLRDRLIDEIILDVHPLIMAKGIRLFEAEFPYQNLQLLEYKEINDNILQMKYKVIKQD
jgi:dihydrofolate reductase